MGTTSNISFPNIGINDLQVDRVAFTLFGRQVYWYGLLITASIILAYFYVQWRAKQERIKSDDITDLALWVVIGGIVGARAYYVLTSLDQYDSVIDMFKIWNGGLAFYGCVIGGAIAAIIFARIKKLNFAVLADMIAPTLLLAQAIGRWGNFFNAEAFGSVTQWDFFGHVFDISQSVKLPWIMYINGFACQPTFLYECVWNLIGFAILTALYKKKKFNGQITLSYLVCYGFARMIVEGFRTDSLPLGTLRISQLVGAASVVCGIPAILICLYFAKKGKLKTPFTFPEAPSEEPGDFAELIRALDEENEQQEITDLQELDGADPENTTDSEE